MSLIWMGSSIKFLLRQIKVGETSMLICLKSGLNKTDSGYKQSNIPVRLNQFCTELATINDRPNATSSLELLYAFEAMKGFIRLGVDKAKPLTKHGGPRQGQVWGHSEEYT